MPLSLLVYGGVVVVEMMDNIHVENRFEFTIPPNTKVGQQFRFDMPVGPVIITLVNQG